MFSRVNRIYQFPLFSYNIGGMPIYYYLMIAITFFVIIAITILEKSQFMSLETESKWNEVEKEPEEELKTLGGKQSLGGKHSIKKTNRGKNGSKYL